jgi:hypothetical protein
MRHALLIAGILGCAALVAGCDELPQAAAYKQGEYQGKPDTLPWDGGAFKGDKTVWENAVKTRTLGQNEYVRIAQ